MESRHLYLWGPRHPSGTPFGVHPFVRSHCGTEKRCRLAHWYGHRMFLMAGVEHLVPRYDELQSPVQFLSPVHDRFVVWKADAWGLERECHLRQTTPYSPPVSHFRSPIPVVSTRDSVVVRPDYSETSSSSSWPRPRSQRSRHRTLEYRDQDTVGNNSLSNLKEETEDPLEESPPIYTLSPSKTKIRRRGETTSHARGTQTGPRDCTPYPEKKRVNDPRRHQPVLTLHV